MNFSKLLRFCTHTRSLHLVFKQIISYNKNYFIYCQRKIVICFLVTIVLKIITFFIVQADTKDTLYQSFVVDEVSESGESAIISLTDDGKICGKGVLSKWVPKPEQIGIPSAKLLSGCEVCTIIIQIKILIIDEYKYLNSTYQILIEFMIY